MYALMNIILVAFPSFSCVWRRWFLRSLVLLLLAACRFRLLCVNPGNVSSSYETRPVSIHLWLPSVNNVVSVACRRRRAFRVTRCGAFLLNYCFRMLVAFRCGFGRNLTAVNDEKWPFYRICTESICVVECDRITLSDIALDWLVSKEIFSPQSSNQFKPLRSSINILA